MPAIPRGRAKFFRYELMANRLKSGEGRVPSGKDVI